MEQFTAIFTAVLELFQHKFTLYGFTISYWDVLIWCSGGLYRHFVYKGAADR
ncbi:MAG: hypothetical protein ACLRYE_08340 [Gemmiger formicilis]|uniref:hypothetical protein n=1 Tax=Gemmiger formicilis TaxID=745368 RepID=UPI0039A1944E